MSIPAIPRTEWLQVVEKAPLVSIDLIVRDPENRVLLGWRCNEPAKDSWFTLGVAIRKGETLDAAFARLTISEFGVAATRQEARFVGLYEHVFKTNFMLAPGIGTHYVVLAYELRLPHGRVTADAQHAELRWFTVAELMADARVHPLVKQYPL